ncbi:hypothetical protein MPAR168_12820 [Methylorubrum populi]|uniref:Uncharacterized protein n=1 Tax=Methylobacterium radiotolerans TaxID=31998 RepID=A0ABU7T7G1_9HYPH
MAVVMLSHPRNVRTNVDRRIGETAHIGWPIDGLSDTISPVTGSADAWPPGRLCSAGFAPSIAP